MLNYLTPHGKWSIHSNYGDNHRMLTLSRGCHPFWINEQDAAAIGVVDNDWVEVYNDHGVVVTRAIVSARLPRGLSFLYHSPERTVGVPKSPLRGNKRAGGHNSLNRIRLKPNLMLGGYGQFTYGWNYWGPTGANLDTYILVRKLKGNTCLQMCVVGRNTFIGAGSTFTDYNLLPTPIRALDGNGKLGLANRPVLGGCVGHNCRLGAGIVIFPARTIESDLVLFATQGRRVIDRDVRYEDSDHHQLSFAHLHPRLYKRQEGKRKETW